MSPPDLPGMPPKVRRTPRILMSRVDGGVNATKWHCRVCGWNGWITHSEEDQPPRSYRAPCPRCNVSNEHAARLLAAVEARADVLRELE